MYSDWKWANIVAIILPGEEQEAAEGGGGCPARGPQVGRRFGEFWQPTGRQEV